MTEVSSPGGSINTQREPLTRQRLIRLIIVIVVGAGLIIGVGQTKDYFVLQRFAVVMPGFVYRSAAPQARPLRRAIRDYQLTTVLTLLNDEPTRREKAEQAVCKEMGVRMIRLSMPGSGLACYDDLEKAADILATPENRPILVHCAAGVKRTGAVVVAYRLKHCASTLQEALNECDQQGSPIADDEELYKHLRGFEERIRIRLEAMRQVLSTMPVSHSSEEP